jgi:CHASE2 domain-containing sensor protein
VELKTSTSRACRSPFPGLDPFTASEDDAEIFAGRDAESDLVTANLRAATLTILYGPSGVGKSSLLRAGVVSRVSRQPRRGRHGSVPPPTIIVHDEWAGDAGDALARRVTDALGNGAAGDDAPPLDVALERWATAARGQLLVILDQFEEYLRLHSELDGDSFDRLFPDVAGRDELPVHFLLSLRDDALAELDRYQGRMPGLFGNYLRLEHMSPKATRAAMIEPIGRVNTWRELAELPRVEVEAGLVEEVLADLSDPRLLSGQRAAALGKEGRAPIELAFLQLVMRRLWDADARGDVPVLQRSTLHDLGGAEAIVAGHLDAQMDALTREQRETAAAMFGYLVTPSGAKIRYTARDLAGYARQPEEAVSDVLEALSRPQQRVIRRVPAPSGGPEGHGYEIFHDVLASSVRGWGLRSRAARLERKSRRLGSALAAAVAAIVALVAYAIDPAPLRRLDLATIDLRFGLRGAGTIDPQILVVAVDQRTLDSTIAQAHPLPPISRSNQARVLAAIDAGRPRVIVEAIEYADGADKARGTDRLLAALARSRAPVVLSTRRIDNSGQTTLFGSDVMVGDKSMRLPSSRLATGVRVDPMLLHATVGYGSFPPEADGSIRRVRDVGRQSEGYLGLPTVAVRAARLSRAGVTSFPEEGAPIDFAGEEGTYPRVSLLDVLERRVPASRFDDKIVVVGETNGPRALRLKAPGGGGTHLSAPEAQANAIATVRAGLPLRKAPAWSVVLLIVALAIVPAVLTIGARAVVAAGVAAVLGAGFLVGAQVAFEQGWIVPVVVPLLALLVSAAARQVAMRAAPGARDTGRAVPA